MELYFGNSRPAPSIVLQAEVDLYHWRIVRLRSGLLHIAAQMESGSFRVTTALCAIDLSRKIIRTESGRSYRLCVPPENDSCLAALMIANAARGALEVADDVSDVVWSAVESGVWPSEGGGLIPALQ